jgi:hypothetical protein
MKYLYLLTQDENNGYDTFDSVVVCAESAVQAMEMTPDTSHPWGRDGFDSSWANHKEKVNYTYLGVACPSLKPGIILASFNAG